MVTGKLGQNVAQVQWGCCWSSRITTDRKTAKYPFWEAGKAVATRIRKQDICSRDLQAVARSISPYVDVAESLNNEGYPWTRGTWSWGLFRLIEACARQGNTTTYTFDGHFRYICTHHRWASAFMAPLFSRGLKTEVELSGTMMTRLLDPRLGWKQSSDDDFEETHEVSGYEHRFSHVSFRTYSKLRPTDVPSFGNNLPQVEQPVVEKGIYLTWR